MASRSSDAAGPSSSGLFNFSLGALFSGRNAGSGSPSAEELKSPGKRRLRRDEASPSCLPPPDDAGDANSGRDSGFASELMMGQSPMGAREIRARPIDVEKEIQLLFVAENEPCPPDGPAPSIPASRMSSVNSNGMPGTPGVLASSTEITIPQCTVVDTVESIAAAKKFRRPTSQMIRHRTADILALQEGIAEYELDDEDEAWLAEFNQGVRQPLLDEDRMEELMDALEKASFKALHGVALQAQRMQSSAPPLPSSLGQSSRWESKRPLHAGLPSPRPKAEKKEKKPKPPKAAKVDKHPPPSDHELINLPSGLCRRYQQGKCHK
eukprot:gene3374-3751_t